MITVIPPSIRTCAFAPTASAMTDWVVRAEPRRATRCSFCDAAAKRRHRPPFHEVIAHMLSRLGRDYNDPESASIAYESAEGGLAQLAPIPSLFAEISDNCPMIRMKHSFSYTALPKTSRGRSRKTAACTSNMCRDKS